MYDLCICVCVCVLSVCMMCVCLHIYIYAPFWQTLSSLFILFANNFFNCVVLSVSCAKACWHSCVHMPEWSSGYEWRGNVWCRPGSWCLPLRRCAKALEITSQDAANGQESDMEHGTNTVPTIDTPETCSKMLIRFPPTVSFQKPQATTTNNIKQSCTSPSRHHNSIFPIASIFPSFSHHFPIVLPSSRSVLKQLHRPSRSLSNRLNRTSPALIWLNSATKTRGTVVEHREIWQTTVQIGVIVFLRSMFWETIGTSRHWVDGFCHFHDRRSKAPKGSRVLWCRFLLDPQSSPWVSRQSHGHPFEWFGGTFK